MLLDEASLLACSAYVDLNPVRAAIAETPVARGYTGAKDRLDDLARRFGSTIWLDDLALREDRTRMSIHDWERSRRRHKSGWLSLIEIHERDDSIGAGVAAIPPGQGWIDSLAAKLRLYRGSD